MGQSLNISTTKIKDWAEVDKLRKFPALEDLRSSHCPFLEELSAHEKRTMLIARLPNVQVLNGGDKIGPVEREDAERAFIRHFLDTPENERPVRFDELVAVHGLLDPLVNVDLTPEKVGSEHQTHQVDHKRLRSKHTFPLFHFPF